MSIQHLFGKYKDQSFDQIKRSHSDVFNKIYHEENPWLDSLEEKTYWIKAPTDKEAVDNVIAKLRNSEYVFSSEDIGNLETFTRIINTIVRTANRINNFKQGTPVDNGTLDLPILFNTIKQTDSLSNLSVNLNKNLRSFIPHLYSIIKHCQSPDEYPIYYKYWSNIACEVFNIPKEYDALCRFYRGFPKEKRHLNFGSYMGAIGTLLAKDISKETYIKEEDDNVYKFVKENLLNLPKYFNLIDGYTRHPRYYVIGSKYGENANNNIFPELLKQNVIAVGFAGDKDLTSYYGEDEKLIASYLSENGEDSKSVKALQKFLNIRPGDFVAVKGSGNPKGGTGYLSIVGYARVIVKDGNLYKHQPDNLGHIIHVEYLNAPTKKEFPLGGYGKTVHLLTKPEHIKLIFKPEDMAHDPFSPFRKWLQDNYKRDNGKGLEKKTIENYMGAIKTNNADILTKQLSDKDIYEIEDAPTIKKLKNNYFDIPEIKEKDSKGNGMYSASFNRYVEFVESKFIEPKEQKKQDRTGHRLNTIFYGPPGTGKTYNTVNKALEILGEKLEGLSRKQIKELYNNYVKDGRIVFTTFHQSLSYEDFIEGIRPVPPQTYQSPIQYKVKDGIFKVIARKAGQTEEQFIQIAGERNELSKEILLELYNSFASKLPSTKEKETSIILQTVGKYKFGLFRNSANSITVRPLAGTTDMSLAYSELEAILFDKKPPTYPSYANIVIDKILDDQQITFEKTDNTKKNYVLIIDEINRGNVSQIFGELITLIEEDKREKINAEEGEYSEALKITLPYSQSEFSVPDNLYILGTMNTADRSVEALDSALRRRFVFEEMSPKPEKIADIRKSKKLDEQIGNIDLGLLLTTINNRIERLLDRDHAIGHSYLIDCKSSKDLRDTFYKNIIPLLQEYFYGDYAKIGLVLGAGFVQVKNSDTSFASFDHDSIDIFNDRKVYGIIDYRDKEKQTILHKDKSEEISFDKAIGLLLNREIKSNSEE